MTNNNSNHEKFAEAKILCSQTLLVFVFFFGLVYVTSSYLQRSTFENLLSFYGPDGPGLYPNVVLPKPFGVHFFGDFLLPQWQSRLSDPWLYKEWSGPPVTNYLPFTMGVFWIFSQLSYWKSFLIFLTLSLSALVVPLRVALRDFEKFDKLQLFIGSVFLTGPMVSLLDRGNIQLLLVAICISAFALHKQRRVATSAILLGLAIALKGYPIVLLIFYIREKKWKAVCISAGTAVVATIIPLLFYSEGIIGSLSAVWHNVKVNEVGYSTSYLSYNGSIRGSLRSFDALNLPLVSSLSGVLLSHAELVLIPVILLSFVILLNKRTTNFEVALVSVALMCGTVSYVAPYAFGLLFIALFVLWSEGSQVPRKWFISYGWIIAILLAPKGIPVKFWNEGFAFSSPTYTSLLGGICSVSLIVLIAIRTTNRESLREILQLKILRN